MNGVRTTLTLATGAWMSWMAVTAGQTPGAPSVPDMAGKVMTVAGPVPPEQLGHTLMHEHLFIDFSVPFDEPDRWRLAGRTRPTGATQVGFYNAPLTMDILGAVTLGAANRDNYLLDDEKTAIAEVAELKRHGGGTIVDVTSTGLGRRPEALRRIAQATGVNIVMGSSWYARGWHPAELDVRSIESLTEEIVRDVTIGVDGTNVRSGIIGEVGTGAGPLSPNEIKVVKASGRASRLTGAAISVHAPGLLKQQPHVLDLLAGEGADLSRVVLGHSDFLADDLPFARQLLDRGATIEFDLLGRPTTVRRRWPSDIELARAVVDLIKAGYTDRLVLSHDICTKTSLKAYGGTGYSYIEETFLPYLKRQGVTDAQINTLVVENPKRLLTFVAPQTAQPTASGAR